ncbi:MAG: hypothetical protein K2N91_07675, partial [Muribaculaceae bacterium]|nr:hypothetical protein [Muribaculaceae bacterium]
MNIDTCKQVSLHNIASKRRGNLNPAQRAKRGSVGRANSSHTPARLGASRDGRLLFIYPFKVVLQ